MIKDILKNYNKKLPLLLFFFSIIILNTYLIISINIKEEKKEDIYRLHVVANSNSIADQIIKLKVEAKVEDYLNTISHDENDDILYILNQNSEEILNVANKVLNENNIHQNLTLDIGKITYDKKENILYSMDSGSYNSARIIIGKGLGKNIWTLIFPNEKTIKNISSLNTILPGIENIYSTDEADNDTIYDFKIIEFIKDIQKHLNS